MAAAAAAALATIYDEQTRGSRLHLMHAAAAANFSIRRIVCEVYIVAIAIDEDCSLFR